MSDDERLQRLTELARRVWPDRKDVEVELQLNGAHVIYRSVVLRQWMGGEDEMVFVAELLAVTHPNALDALEAALHALAGETPQPHWVDELWGRWTAWAMQHESMQARRDPETETMHEGAVLAYRRCAAELRERAKEDT